MLVKTSLHKLYFGELEVNSWLLEEKGMTEDEMAGWHHQHDGHGFG